jgi:hypothetical protein
VYQGKPTLSCLEYVLNFEQFDKSKTCTYVSDWMFESFREATVLNGDFLHLAADGASNAIGSIVEFESLSHPTRSNDVALSVCIAHQNEWSGGYASGTIAFAEPANDELGLIIDKSRKIQVRMSCLSQRMAAYCDIQTETIASLC